MRTVKLAEASGLPPWRRPFALLLVMATAMPLSFAVWTAVLQNFVIEVAGFDGSDWGWLQTSREIPGLLAVGVIAVLYLMREQILAIVSLVLLGLGVILTAQLPSFQGLIFTTMLGSVGFHYYETVNQSLQLQWLPKARAPQLIGWIVAAGSGASLFAYALLVAGWKTFGWTYEAVLLVAGGTTIIAALAAFMIFPQFESHEPQLRSMVLRRRYWLYYALQFMAGARRQIFVVFAAFMMVERFGFEVNQVTALFLINFLANMLFAPVMGSIVGRFGERRALLFEYAGLAMVFLAYGGVYFFGWGMLLAAGLYVVDHLFFALALALKTYFQKIADPRDIAPTAAVAFTINHIAAVFLPAALGYLWIRSPGAVFSLAAAMAAVSFVLALLIPRHPAPGNETVLNRLVNAPAE